MGVRATGTDLFLPNHLSAVCRAQAGADTEQRFYAYTGEALQARALDQLIAELVGSLEPASFELALREVRAAEEEAEQERPRSYESMQAHHEAQRATRRVREELAEVEALKQRYL